MVNDDVGAHEGPALAAPRENNIVHTTRKRNVIKLSRPTEDLRRLAERRLPFVTDGVPPRGQPSSTFGSPCELQAVSVSQT